MFEISKCAPVNDYLLVRPTETQDVKTQAGIILAGSSTDSIKTAEVIAVEPHLEERFPPGCTVVYQNNGYDSFPSFKTDPADPKTKHILLSKQFVLMVLKK